VTEREFIQRCQHEFLRHIEPSLAGLATSVANNLEADVALAVWHEVKQHPLTTVRDHERAWMRLETEARRAWQIGGMNARTQGVQHLRACEAVQGLSVDEVQGRRALQDVR
jgi:hypothetical protein